MRPALAGAPVAAPWRLAGDRTAAAIPAARRALRLALAWWTLALVALGLSVLGAVVLVAARTPFLALGAGVFRTALVVHVNLAVVVWFLAAAVGVWLLGAPRPVAGPWAWGGVGLAASGLAIMVVAPWSGTALPVLANYIPVLDSRPYLAGLGLFALGVGLTAMAVLPGWCRPIAGKPWQWAAAAALMALLGAAAVFLLAQGTGSADMAVEQRVWGIGHQLQAVHTLLLMAAWLALAEGEGAGRGKFALAIAVALLPALAGVFLALATGPESQEYRQGFTAIMRWGSWPGPLLLAVLLLADRKGPGRGAVLGSGGLFLLGCLVGTTIHGESTAVPAHYHGTVGAITLAYMLWGWRWRGRLGAGPARGGLVRWQPRLYGLGVALLVVGLAWSGWVGAPRKAPHVAGLVAAGDYPLAMGLAGVGGGLATLGAGLFVLSMLSPLGSSWRTFMKRSAPRSTFWSTPGEERWRVWLLVGLALLLGGLGFQRWPDSPLAGTGQSDRHAKAKRLEEVDRRFREGVAMLHARQYDYALTAFHRVLELAPELPEAHVNAGYALLGLRQPAAARDFFESATNLRPDQFNAYYGLGESLEALGDLFGALQAMETYLHRAPRDDRYRRQAEAAVWEWRQQLDARRSRGSGRP